VWQKESSSAIYCGIPSSDDGGNYPEDWYMGVLQTEDTLLKVDLVSQSFSNVSNLSEESGQKIDIEDMIISSDDSHLVFRNKIDGSLWLLRISE
jgi:hypothetical protein